MRLFRESGLWNTGAVVEGAPLDAPVEVAGAVLSWTIDDAGGPPRITFTDAARADWLWRVVGVSGHVELLAALADPAAADAVEAPGVEAAPEALAPLRRLAMGHWLRRWWPASARDGIPALDAVLLDAEIALLTDEAGYAFSDDTLDSDAAELLRPHTAALASYLDSSDDRIADDRIAGGIADERIADDRIADDVRVGRDAAALFATGRRGVLVRTLFDGGFGHGVEVGA